MPKIRCLKDKFNVYKIQIYILAERIHQVIE